MTLRLMLSSITLASALLASGGASAVTIGGVTIPPDQMGSFEEKCAALSMAATQSLSAPIDESDNAATGSIEASGDDEDVLLSTDPLANKTLHQLLANLTPEQCTEAGLGFGAAPQP